GRARPGSTAVAWRCRPKPTRRRGCATPATTFISSKANGGPGPKGKSPRGIQTAHSSPSSGAMQRTTRSEPEEVDIRDVKTSLQTSLGASLRNMAVREIGAFEAKTHLSELLAAAEA